MRSKLEVAFIEAKCEEQMSMLPWEDLWERTMEELQEEARENAAIIAAQSRAMED